MGRGRIGPVGLTVAIAAALLAGSCAKAQMQEQAESTDAASADSTPWTPPFLQDGQPDMQGIYVPEWGSVPPERSTQDLVPAPAEHTRRCWVPLDDPALFVRHDNGIQ